MNEKQLIEQELKKALVDYDIAHQEEQIVFNQMQQIQAKYSHIPTEEYVAPDDAIQIYETWRPLQRKKSAIDKHIQELNRKLIKLSLLRDSDNELLTEDEIHQLLGD